MIRKCTDEDISDEELEKVINSFYDNYHEYIITYVMPEVIAFYIASSFIRNAMWEATFYQHYNSAKDTFNIGDDEDDLLNDDTVIVDVFSKIYFGNILSDKTNAFKVGEELIHPEWIKNKQSYFGLIMPDNTMNPEFHQNDCIILRGQNKMTKDGFYCVMEKGQDIATIRKLITINDGIMVMPLNLGSDFKPTTYLKGTIEYENFRVIGSVVQVKRYYD